MPTQVKIVLWLVGMFAVGVFFVLPLLFGSWYTINQTERGVILRNGAIVGTAEPGLHFKTPWIESVVDIDTTIQTWSWDKMEAYSADQQPIHLRVSVTGAVKPDRVGELYSEYGSLTNAVNRLLTPRVFQQSKIVFGQNTAITAVQNRAKLNNDIQQAIFAALGDHTPLSITSVQVEDIQLPPTYLSSIDARMQAEVEVQRLQQKAQQAKVEADIAVTQAMARANSVRAEAQAAADAQTLSGEAAAKVIALRGEAEGRAIKAKTDALKDNPNLVQLTQAERWDGKLPTQMMPNSALPILQFGVK